MSSCSSMSLRGLRRLHSRQRDMPPHAAERAMPRLDRSLVRLDDRADDREPEARAAGVAIARALDTVQPVGQMCELVIANAGTRIHPVEHDARAFAGE